MNWARLVRAVRLRALTTRKTSYPSPLFRIEQLEERCVPATVFPFTANAFGGGSFNPFPGFTGQIETASADISGGSVPDIITAEGPGPGSNGEVRIFSGASAEQGQAVLIADFFPYSNVAGAGTTPGFLGGVYVAAANFSGPGDADLVTSTGPGGPGHVKVFGFAGPNGLFLGSDPTVLSSFIVYPGYNGPVQIAAIENGTGTPLLVTASGPGATAADVRVFNNAATIGSVADGVYVAPAAQTFVYPGYLGGVAIAAGGSSTSPELYLAPMVGNTPEVSVFNIAPGGVALAPSFTFSTGTGNQTDMRLASADLYDTGALDVLTAFIGPSGASPISVYSITNGVAIPMPDLNGLTGFGLYSGEWLYAGTFAPTAAEQAAEVPATVAATTTATTPMTVTTATAPNATSIATVPTTIPPPTQNNTTPVV
jgi:hypothetical protein